MHIISIIREFIVAWGYWAVAAGLLLENSGVPVPGETILILASVFAYNRHELRLPWIIVVGTVAATCGDNVGFWIGHKGGRPLLERWRHLFHIKTVHIRAGELLIEKHGPWAIFFARFVAGARIVAGPLAGVLRMEWKRFALFNFLGALVWVTVISSLGYAFGSQFDRLTKIVKELDYGIIVAIVVIAAFLYWRYRRRRTGREEMEVH